jgi:hypothetical protein
MLLLCAIGDIRAVSRGRDPRGRPARAYPAGRTGRSRRADEDRAASRQSGQGSGRVDAWRTPTTTVASKDVDASSGRTDAPEGQLRSTRATDLCRSLQA